MWRKFAVASGSQALFPATPLRGLAGGLRASAMPEARPLCSCLLSFPLYCISCTYPHKKPANKTPRRAPTAPTRTHAHRPTRTDCLPPSSTHTKLDKRINGNKHYEYSGTVTDNVNRSTWSGCSPPTRTSQSISLPRRPASLLRPECIPGIPYSSTGPEL